MRQFRSGPKPIAFSPTRSQTAAFVCVCGARMTAYSAFRKYITRYIIKVNRRRTSCTVISYSICRYEYILIKYTTRRVQQVRHGPNVWEDILLYSLNSDEYEFVIHVRDVFGTSFRDLNRWAHGGSVYIVLNIIYSGDILAVNHSCESNQKKIAQRPVPPDAQCQGLF